MLQYDFEVQKLRFSPNKAHELFLWLVNRPPPQRTAVRNKGLIAGLVKEKQLG